MNLIGVKGGLDEDNEELKSYIMEVHPSYILTN